MVTFTDLPTDIGHAIAATLAVEAHGVLHNNGRSFSALHRNEAFDALSKLSRTCHGYHGICVPYLYRRFGVAVTAESLRLFLRTIIQHASLAAMVKEVCFANIYRISGLKDEKRSIDRLPLLITPQSFLQSLQQANHGLGTYLLAFLAFLPSLESLTFIWCGDHLELPPFSMDFIAQMQGTKRLRHFNISPVSWIPEEERKSLVPDLETLKAAVQMPWACVKYEAHLEEDRRACN